MSIFLVSKYVITFQACQSDPSYTCVYAALVKANERYSSKVREGKSTRQAIYTLGWKVDELNRLVRPGKLHS